MLLEIDESERLAAPLSIEAFHDLVDWWVGSTEPEISPPLVLGWDIHRQWPGDRGFAIWRDLMLTYEAPLFVEHLFGPGDPRRPTTPEQYEAALIDQWAAYERPKHWTDSLIVDVMHDERERGFEPCGDASDRTEAILNDLAAKVGAKRASDQAERNARLERYRQRAQRFFELDDAGYAQWLAAGRPWSDAKKVERWSERRFHEQLGKARVITNNLPPCPVSPPTPLPEHPNLSAQQAVALEDFYACLPAGAFIFTPTREMWPATSVNSRIGPVAVPMKEKPIQASSWLATHRAVEQMTWAPGRPMVISDKLIADGGWIDRAGCSVFNLYRAPTIKPAAGDASPWIEHVQYVFGDEADHIIKWLAHRVQRPEQKINHALVLGGAQGIGKDTLLEPVKQAIGPWNFTEVSPVQMLGRFNGFVKSVILRISEARDLGDVDRYGFYEHMKTLTAAPPDVLRVDEKHLREHAVVNVCGVIVTTNNKDSMHLPPDDRRHFVAWSGRSKEDFKPDYWNALYRWFSGGGTEIAAHYLATIDLSDFDAKAPPPKTPAFWEMVDSSRAPEDAEMADAIDALGKPAAVTLAHVLTRAVPSFGEWLQDRRNRRKIPHRFEECGYVAVRNPSAADGYWVVNGKRAPIYARRELSARDQIAAAEKLTAAGLPVPP
ncbi:primase-helicase family protein, partial [Bradyrhizobium sp. HKCCYLS2038]|uniref:primase-helicase family protein n=1 Tax=unclassified Bradyrhizobium TaxID=2631580 RepID=UPI003EBCF8DC